LTDLINFRYISENLNVITFIIANIFCCVYRLDGNALISSINFCECITHKKGVTNRTAAQVYLLYLALFF